MHWNVAQLLQSSLGTQRAYSVDEPDDRQKELAGSVVGTVRMMKTDRGILVRARLSTEVWCTCSRCLTQFVEPVSFKIDEVFHPSTDTVHGGKLEEPESGGAFMIGARHTLDLGEPTRQHALMSVSMKPLCAPDCSGLCSTCGSNLNQEECGCPKRHADPRWASLEQLSSNPGAH